MSNIVTIKIEEEEFKALPESIRQLFTIDKIEPERTEHPDDARWLALKEKANAGYKDYKALKKYEFELRHGKPTTTS